MNYNFSKELSKKIEQYKNTMDICVGTDCFGCVYDGEPKCIDKLLVLGCDIINELIAHCAKLERNNENKVDDIILPSGADKAVKKAILDSFEKYYKAESYTDVWDFERAIKRFKVLEDLND